MQQLLHQLRQYTIAGFLMYTNGVGPLFASGKNSVSTRHNVCFSLPVYIISGKRSPPVRLLHAVNKVTFSIYGSISLN